MKGTGRFAIETSNAILDEASCAGRRGFIPGDYVRLSVSDTGHGMDKTTMEHAFEPFFTTKPVGRGTGLGLAMVYGIVQQNHGFVGVESDLDRGTTFSIYLPRHIGPPSSAPAVDGGEPAGGIGEVVLLVEDEPAALRMASRMLEGLGYAVLPARTPAEALKRAESREQGIDLILTDVIMPEMNGRDLAEKVRALRPGIKVLYMSGYSGEIIARQGALEEGVRLLQKPFSEKALARAIREALAE
jgi:CheY-like chemotaxis protein